MTSRHPPRIALSVLERFVPNGSSLAGDLVEEFHRGRSRAWFWWQVFAAVATAWSNRPDEIRPLRLVDLQPSDAQERSRRMSLRFRDVNLTASPLHGVGGLGLVVLALLVTAVMPAAWWVLGASVLAGIALGVAMVTRRRSRLLRDR